MLNAEMDVHLGCEDEREAGKHRNGTSTSTKHRPRAGGAGHPTRPPRSLRPGAYSQVSAPLPGFDEKIIALYAHGMSTPDIRSHVGELYGVDISPTLASAVTDSVIDEGRAWQSRPLESTYAIVFFDALRVKIRDEGLVRNKAVYLAISVRCSGPPRGAGPLD